MITLEIVEGMDCGAGDQQLRKGLGYHSADGPTETIEYNSTLRGTTLPKSGTPRKAQQLPYSLHVPEAAEFNPEGVILSPLVYNFYVVPFVPSLHSNYVSRTNYVSHLVST